MSAWITWNGGECLIPAGYAGRVETLLAGERA